MTRQDQDERLLARLDEVLSTAALSELAEGQQAGESEHDHELRESLELMGLLAYELEPAPPHPRVKDAIFERLGLEPAEVEISGATEAAGPTEDGVVVSAVELARRQGNRWAATPTWLTTLAAAAVLLAVALGLFSGALLGRLRERNHEVARLADRVDRLEALGEVDQLHAELALARDRLALMTSPAAEVCALSPRSAAQPNAQGAVFMNRRSREWVLAANNLAPSNAGESYSLWFKTGAGNVRGGTFQVDEATGKIEISSDQLPIGTEAILITLDPEDASEPGETVLYGDEARHIL